MNSNEEKKALSACIQRDGSYRKEIESTGVFLGGLRYYTEYVAQQPNGQWQAFDCQPVLTDKGWDYQGDSPDNLKVEGDLGVAWDKTLYRHDRYKPTLSRERKTFRVKGM